MCEGKLSRDLSAQSHFGTPLGRLVLWLVALSLCCYGVFFIYSTGYIGDAYPVRPNWIRQLVWLALGSLLGWLVGHAHPRGLPWRTFVWGGYGASLILLVVVLFAGRSIGGARRWLQLGPVMIQPAEFAKFFTLMAFCELLCWTPTGFRSLVIKWVLLSALFLAPFLLIVLAPSVGNAFSLLPGVLCVVGIYLLGRRLWATLVFFGVVLIICFCGFVVQIRASQEVGSSGGNVALGGFFKGYHSRRIADFLTPRGGWNERQSLMTLASGGRFGKGYLQGDMKGLGYLPRTVAPTDFIFSVIGEELGFYLGCLPILLLYMVLFGLGFHWAGHSNDECAGLRCVAVLMLLLTHVLVNVGMTVRLVPIIGLPLPFLSYGGSFTVTTFLCLGVLHSTSRMSCGGLMSADSPKSNEWSLGRLLRVRIQRVK